jgi:hypothetical protein
MKNKTITRRKQQPPSEDDLRKEARSLQELVWLSMLVLLSLLLLLLLFLVFA